MPTVKDITSFFVNLWGHIFVDAHVIRWWDPTNANTNLWQDLGLGWQGMCCIFCEFCETCTTSNQKLREAGLHSRPTAASERHKKFLSFFGSFVVFHLVNPFLSEAAGSSMQFQEVVADHDMHFPLNFPKVQGAICVQPPYVYVQTIAMLVNAWVSKWFMVWYVSIC